MKAAIIQPNYIPWIGYFEIIKEVDFFVFLDDVQFTRRDWRNRNYIRKNNYNEDKELITIPVKNKGNFNQKINEMKVEDHFWLTKHLQKFKNNYEKTPHHNDGLKFFEEIYERNSDIYLANNTIGITRDICEFLKIKTKFIRSSEISLKYDDYEKNNRLIEICKKIDASVYFSGPASKNYISKDQFLKNGIDVLFFGYKTSSTYCEPIAKKIPNLSIVDLIFYRFKDSYKYLNNLTNE